MGQADRRGPFAERKTKAIIRNNERKERFDKAFENAKTMKAILEKDLSVEEKQRRAHIRNTMLSFMAFAKQSGLTPKELKRRLKRDNKKSN